MKADYIAKCSKQSLPKIRDFVSGELRALKVQDGVLHQLVLAIDEACANSIIHHHSCDGTSSIRVSVSRQGDTLVIELADKGNAFPIDEYKPQEVKDIIHNRTKGGLGIFLINKIMDKVEVEQGTAEFTYRFTKYL
jgi:serine/threonine-protein kinase RsbW